MCLTQSRPVWGSPCPPEALRPLGPLPAEPFLLLLPFLAFSASSAALGRQWPSVLSVHTQKRCAIGPRQNLLLVRFSHSFVTDSSLPAESHCKPSRPHVQWSLHRRPGIPLVHPELLRHGRLSKPAGDAFHQFFLCYCVIHDCRAPCTLRHLCRRPQVVQRAAGALATYCAMGPSQNLLLMQYSHFSVSESFLPPIGQAALLGFPTILTDR